MMDNWARRVGRYLLHESDSDLPHNYFPNGVSELAGHEYIGVLLVLLIMLQMDGPHDTILSQKIEHITK